jgi:quinol monooxygenase YgiN
MIVRTWSGRVPREKAACFADHLIETGVRDYRAQPGCSEVALWRQDLDDDAVFTLVSVWADFDSIRAYAGDDPERAVLYEGDDAFGLIPDRVVRHHHLVDLPA